MSNKCDSGSGLDKQKDVNAEKQGQESVFGKTEPWGSAGGYNNELYDSSDNRDGENKIQDSSRSGQDSYQKQDSYNGQESNYGSASQNTEQGSYTGENKNQEGQKKSSCGCGASANSDDQYGSDVMSDSDIPFDGVISETIIVGTLDDDYDSVPESNNSGSQSGKSCDSKK